MPTLKQTRALTQITVTFAPIPSARWCSGWFPACRPLNFHIWRCSFRSFTCRLQCTVTVKVPKIYQSIVLEDFRCKSPRATCGVLRQSYIVLRITLTTATQIMR